MGVSVSEYGSLNGEPVRLITLDSGDIRAVFIDLGARLLELHVPDRRGNTADVVLGYPDIGAHVPGPAYFGATCGRFSNRIRRGRFVLDGAGIDLTVNEGLNHLHGGTVGFDQHRWPFKTDGATNEVRFELESPDGDQGYPGALQITTSYRLNGSTLTIAMGAVTDAPTVINMVHHSYWNLGGHDAGDVLGHEVRLASDLYTPVDDELIPTGEVLSVAGTPFDFRDGAALGARIAEVDHGGAGRSAPAGYAGYDHNWILRGQVDWMRDGAEVIEPRSGRRLLLRTTEPAVQLYTGGYLDGVAGKAGARYQPFAGFTLETQRFPDSPNIGHFPSSVLRPGECYDHRMELTFSTNS